MHLLPPSRRALLALSAAYCLLPCALKLCAALTLYLTLIRPTTP